MVSERIHHEIFNDAEFARFMELNTLIYGWNVNDGVVHDVLVPHPNHNIVLLEGDKSGHTTGSSHLSLDAGGGEPIPCGNPDTVMAEADLDVRSVACGLFAPNFVGGFPTNRCDGQQDNLMTESLTVATSVWQNCGGIDNTMFFWDGSTQSAFLTNFRSDDPQFLPFRDIDMVAHRTADLDINPTVDVGSMTGSSDNTSFGYLASELPNEYILMYESLMLVYNAPNFQFEIGESSNGANVDTC